jgi:uncharacterized protein
MCCITDYSANFAEELYQYYKDSGFTWMQFIPVVERDRQDPSRVAAFSLTDEKYGEFLIQLFDLWLKDFQDGQPTTSIRHFESVFYSYVGLEAPECSFMKECGAYVVIEHNGNVYSCDFFVEPRHRLGNIRQEKIINMLNSKKHDEFGKAKAVLPRKCRFCKWYTKCFGGCTKDRIKDPADHNQPRFCTSYQMFFEHADGRLSQIAANWKRAQADYRVKVENNGIYNAYKDFVKS